MHKTLPSSHRAILLARAWLVLSLFALPSAGADDVSPAAQGKPYNPIIAAASDEAEKAIRTFRVPAGLKVELFAAEPLLANPVAFCIDEKGRVLRRRDLPPWRGGDRHPRPHGLARRRPGLPHRRRPRGDVQEVPGQGVRVLQGRARAGAARRRPRRRRPGRRGDGLRRRLQRPGRRHRRRACWPARATSSTRASPGSGSCATPTATAAADRAHAAARGLRRARRLPRPRPARPAHSGPTAGSISASATAGST